MLLINLNNFDENDIADVDYIRNLIDALVGKFGNVDHTVFAGCKVDRCAKLSFVVFHNLGNFTFVNVTHLYVANDVLDDGARFLDGSVVA